MATKNEVAKATKNEVMGDFNARVLAAAQAIYVPSLSPDFLT